MSAPPRLQVESGRMVLSGHWTLAAMLPDLTGLQAQLATQRSVDVLWDLSALSRLDSAAAVLLWRTWGNAWPARLEISPLHRQVLERVAELPHEIAMPPALRIRPIEFIGSLLLKAGRNLQGMIALFGQLLLDVAFLFKHPADIPWREFTANIYKSGAQALPVTALVGFLIGITISYLSALQLKSLLA